MPRYSTKLKAKPRPKTNFLPLWLALAGLALVVFAGWALLSSRSQATASIEVKGAAKVKVEKETIDHGDLKLGNSVRDDIRVTNVGDQPLRFTEAPYIEVKKGC